VERWSRSGVVSRKPIGIRSPKGGASGWKVAVATAAPLLGLVMFLSLFMSSISSATGQAPVCTVTGKGTSDIPAEYVPWLEAAAVKYKLGPKGFSIVAAIHYVESDFGQSPLPGVAPGTTNFAGAAGPGQFLLTTWATYGVDANGDGVKDVYSVPDSIFGTANYLHASGAPKNWWSAIFAYNHAGWYVEEVLDRAKKYEGAEVCHQVGSELGSLPPAGVGRVEYVARWIESRRISYCWGGGHGPKPGPSNGTGEGEFCGPGVQGLDCSGSVRWLLVLSGYKDPGGITSGSFSSVYPSGPGQFVTIWSNADHVFVTINGRDWGTSTSNFHNGPGYTEHTHEGFLPSHPAGL
jgi:hypothetical protein